MLNKFIKSRMCQGDFKSILTNTLFDRELNLLIMNSRTGETRTINVGGWGKL